MRFTSSRFLYPVLFVLPLAILSLHICQSQLEHSFLSISAPPIQQILPELRKHKRGFQRLFLINEPLTDTRYAYCSLAKNGCSIHMGLIHRLFGSDTYHSPGTVHNTSKNREWQAHNMPDDEVVKFLEQPVHRYAVIRNPIMRTLSGYRNKVEPFMTEEQQKIGKYAMFNRWVEEQFPENATAAQVDKLNVHWMPQTNQCGFTNPHIISLFTLFRFEKPQKFANYVEEVLPLSVTKDGWGPDNLSFGAFVTGPRERTGNNEDVVLDYYADLKVFDRVVRAMQRDIDTFGYPDEVAALRAQIVRRNKHS